MPRRFFKSRGAVDLNRVRLMRGVLEVKNKYENKLLKSVLSCDSFTAGYIVAVAFLFVPYLASGSLVLAWFIPVVCIIPFALMPLVYLVIHRFDALLFGRYHLALPLSAFVAALSFVIAFSDADNPALVFFGTLLFALAFLIYRYCAFSVRARLLGDGIISSNAYSRGFTAAGAIGAVGTFCGFIYYDGATAYLNTAYVTAGLCVVLAMAHYLITHYDIPRLGGKRVHSVKNVFKTFFSGIDKRGYCSALVFEAGFATVAALTVHFCLCAGLGLWTGMGCMASLLVCYGGMTFVYVKVVKHKSRVLPIVCVCSLIICAVMLVLAAVLDIPSGAAIGIAVAASGVNGVAGAASVRYTKLRLADIKPRITSGTVYILLELTGAAAFAVAFAAAATVLTIYGITGIAAFAYGFTVAAALGIAGFALSDMRGGEETAHKISYELTTAEIERASSATTTKTPD